MDKNEVCLRLTLKILDMKFLLEESENTVDSNITSDSEYVNLLFADEVIKIYNHIHSKLKY